MNENFHQEQLGNSSDQSKDSFPKEITVKYNHKPFADLSQSIDNQTRTLQTANIESTRIPEAQINEQRTANDIARTSTWVNGILLLITAAVFTINIITLWLSRRDVADATKQFEISNRPFIAIGDLKVDSIGQGQKPKIGFNLYNSGKFPAKILSFYYVKGTASANVRDDEIKLFLNSGTPTRGNATNTILSSLPILLPQWITDVSPISKEESDSIKNGKKVLLLSIEVKYQNFLTGVSYLKKEIYKILAAGTPSILLVDGTEGAF